MGKRKSVPLIDDLDGTTADETVEFGLDGLLYSIELSSANAEALRRTVEEWADRGRRVRAQQRRHLVRADPWRKQVSGQERVQIREWCHANGYRVGRRGPLPFEAVDAYRSAHSQR
ncbi:histone-like nucleoid-structuring protein Lsr2 [Mycolicibacterium hodleri]|uniref:Lsr2 family protein n=1 Tax=Mycolicibacterium hodleri TaxID=49897 RepID=A0A502EC74_9MYCO|nr:Lsr2 family protein [Mycolicibacterium hodleri]TPG34552.1 Lsr2 family protein [Mycolicibacterium hodleri]